MDGDLIGRMIYLGLLAALLGFWFVAENRQSLGKTARMATAWGLIFLGVVVAYGLWDDVRREVLPSQALLDDSTIEVPRSGDGHFHLTLDINGQPVDFLVDTGATTIVLTLEDAQRVGLDPANMAFLGTAQTANGTVRTAAARVDEIALGPVRFENVRVSVNGGEMPGSLLGMDYLSRFERLEIAGNTLRLVP
ncbi:MAG: TIGR02281 family clan AA aspartic protease [Pseudomonadota bacterium]